MKSPHNSTCPDVALIHPSGSNWVSGEPDASTLFNRMPPLGLIAIAAYLEEKGASVRVLDLLGADPAMSEQERIDTLIKSAPTWYGFTTTTSSFLDAYDKAVYIKERHPEGKIVFGGVHVSALGPASLDEYPAIDFAVVGEGEMPMFALVRGDDPAAIAGVAHRVEGHMRFNGRQTEAVAMDELPLPAYHLLEEFPERYRLPLFSGPTASGAPVISSRGCPYSCSFCDRSVFGASYRHNSPEYLLHHMESLHDRFGITHFNMYDDLFTLKRKRVEEVCALLAASDRPFTFNCAVRVGYADAKLLTSLKAGGCWMISLGVESGDEEMLERHKTGVKLSEVAETVAAIRNAGMLVKGLFILGLPGETPESAEKTKQLINQIGFDDINLTRFAPFPGSPAYATIKEYGEFDEDWNKLNCLNFVFRPHGFKDRATMESIYNDIVKSYYMSGRFIRRFLFESIRYPHNAIFIARNVFRILRAGKSFS